MKSILAILLFAAASLALADTEFKTVPPLLQKSIKAGGVSEAQFDAGVLRARVKKPELSEAVYAGFIFHNICAKQWFEPAQFAAMGLSRVELLNAAGTQGYAFDARGEVCAEMGKLGKNFRSFIAHYTVACTAGSCPPQR
ncbi:MAG: hypothetical protein KGM60_11295 [Comamonadaceae bacterium]|nr:hypothetical protein [Pseudomonadota bacterium]MDE2415333.1 hypothetical protein [Comamonadaceae bacterium]